MYLRQLRNDAVATIMKNPSIVWPRRSLAEYQVDGEVGGKTKESETSLIAVQGSTVFNQDWQSSV